MTALGYIPKIGQLWPRISARGRIYGTPIDQILALGPTSLITGAEHKGLVDYAGFGRDGTITGAVTVGARAGPSAAWKFTEAADNPNNGSIQVPLQDFGSQSARSFMAWLFLDDASAAQPVLAGNGVTASSPIVQIQGVGGVDVLTRVQQGDSSSISAHSFAGAWPGAGVWAHFGWAVDLANDLMELVVNGVSQGVSTGITKDWGAATTLRWLANTPLSNPWDGGACYMTTFERRVSQAEFASIAALA